MANPSAEIPIADPELDALIAELEAETAGVVDAPEPVVAAPAAKAKVEPKPEPKPDPVAVAVADAELEAELEVDQLVPPAAPAQPKPAVVSAPPAVAEKPATATAKTVLKAVPPAPASAPAVEATAPGAMAAPDVEMNPKPRVAQALKFGIDVAEFKSETAIRPTDLDNAMIQQSGLRAYYHEQAAQAEAQHARLKARFEVKEAELYDKHRKALAITGEKVTEKAVENAVKLDPQWLRMKNTVIEAETISTINRGLCISLADRKDMLVQLGADRREEGKGQLRIMADQDLRERALSAAKRT